MFTPNLLNKWIMSDVLSPEFEPYGGWTVIRSAWEPRQSIARNNKIAQMLGLADDGSQTPVSYLKDQVKSVFCLRCGGRESRF